VAFVVQRYGPVVTGGSESLARALAERLALRYAITVFTTCARDYVSWRNEYPEGREQLGGVEVRRFRVAAERDLDAFNAFAEPLYARERSREEELAFLERQGPLAPALVETLAREKDEFAAVVFFTYLYYPTVHGLLAAPERSILVPTTHDEPPLRFSIFDELFDAARGFGFLTPPEQQLVERRFGLRGRPWTLAGIGVEVPEAPDAEGFRIRHDLARPYALYAGRIDAGKGCAQLLDDFGRYRSHVRGGLDLVLIGRLAMELPPVPGVRCLGFLSEPEKYAALAGARAVVCPSAFESLSIVLLEGLALGVPGLVSARSPVLVDHCRRSQAGLYYADAAEFAEALDLLEHAPALHAALGRNGQRYVAEHYRWDVVLEHWVGLIEEVAGGGDA
jgi:glycosyltransferase involved in cell wall biosynthesis